MNTAHDHTPSSATRIRAAVFAMVSEGRLSAAEAKRLLVRAEPDAPAPIAVIGMAGRFGECDDLDAYWAMLDAGEHCIRPIPGQRWPDGGRGALGGFLEQPELFDPLFFKIAPSEAGLMDPQQRLFLETAWFALEDAALGERDLAGSACGVFVGVGAGDYGRRLEAAGVGDAPLALMGNVASILAARIAYLLDLKGPALAVDTACSSSLVAVHLACESLRRHECDSAIAGGVCVINSGRFVGAMSQAGMISRSGRCHAFDHRADGFVCGEGAGAIVLKRLDRALADGDRIHGVIVGDGINQDGRTNGITAPSAPAQEALERAVQQRFGIDPAAIGYIETHGTGTPLGDPIEVEALTRAFAARPRHLPRIPLGAVKANIGHTLTAAGIAGLLKVLLMLRAGRIPPSADFQEANPRLGLTDTPFRIATQAEPWVPGPEGRRLATVSSFGFSGTNAHVVVAEAPTPAERPPARGPVAVLLSARDADALAQRAADLAAHWHRYPDLRLDDLAWTLAVGKIHQAQRVAFVAEHREQALAELARIAQGIIPAAPGLSAAVKAWRAGENPDLRAEFPAPTPRRITLPPTRLQRIACDPPGATIPPSDTLEQVQHDTAEFRAHPDPSLFADGEAFALIEAWGRKAACAALSQAGLFAGSRRVLTRAALGREFGVIPQRRGLFDAVLRIAEREQCLVIEGDLLRLSAASWDNTDLARQQADLRRDYPASAPFLDLLQRSTAALPDVLRGRVEGTTVLFPEGRLELVGAIYQGNRLADYFNALMAQAVASLVRQRLDHEAGPVRILEIGAGTGGATTALLAALKPYAARLHYTYTDVSLGFLKHGRDTFGEAVDPALFDATRPGEAQGFATGEFHILIAANVLHAVPDLGETLGYLWRLLAPAGVVVLNEVTAVQDFATLTFGLTEGWWAFRDSSRRLPGAPLADPGLWRAMLAESGFPAMLALGLSQQEPLLQAILLARRDERTATPCPVGTRTTLPSLRPAPLAAVASPVSLEAAIREEAAQTLGMNAAAIDPLGRFMDYGVDSILGLDLINRLNRRYGLSLSPTVVFEQPTVRDLARHLAEDHGVNVAAPPATPTPTPLNPAPAAPREPSPQSEALGGAEPIAVIGMAGRFADADHLEAFHAMLAEGRSGIVLARERLGIDPDQPPEHLKTAAPYLRWGGLLKNIDRFDPMFFRMSGREAELTDPQHRVFLTEVWRALEDAGYAGTALEGADCGIFVGCHGGDYTHLMAEKNLVPDAFAFTGNAASILAARIAYLLDLKGPAVAVDTACSSSLVAVHLACQALRAGECELAIAGGVFINTTVGFNTAAASAGMLSPRGRCAAFDAEADGFVPGEGGGAVLLKPLSKALADGDTVIAVIAGSATNQDGKTNGITAPNAASQAALIQKALRRAGLPPGAVQYVETHGTGTRLGDPIEIEGLTRGFAGSELAPGTCLLGSVKSNVGHAAHAAGIAGLIKVLLSFRHDELYPSLHFHTPNPVLNLARTPFAVNTQHRPWPRPASGRRVAGISSFGFSGTNCHLVLTDPAHAVPVPDAVLPGALIVLAARSPKALAQLRHNLALWLARHASARLVDIAYTLSEGRAHFEYRWAACVADLAGLRAALDQDQPAPALGLAEGRDSRLRTAAQVYLEGGSPDFAGLHPGGRRIPLPTYPFEERSCWLTAPPDTPAVTAPAPDLAQVPPMPSLLTPVWEIRPATPPASLPTRLGLAGDPRRTEPLAAALRSLGVDTVVLSDPRAMPPDGLAALCLCPPTAATSAATLEPLFEVLRARLAQPVQPLPVLYVHDGSPLAAAASAAAPSLRFVAGHVVLRSLALSPALPVGEAARHLLAELAATDPEAAIDHDGQRRVRSLRRLELAPVAAPESGGVWLITGGLGGLGPALARHFGIGRGARIGLLGRSALDGEPAARLAALRAAGVQVHYVAADVADAAALVRAIAEIDGVLGPISGVIHAAGVPSERGLAESCWEDMARTFASKLEGTLALDRALAERRLRAFVLFSSLAAELGDFGQCDYAVANAFLNRFAAWRNAEVAAGRRHGRTLALAWPLWEGGHAALSGEGGELISKALGVRPLARAAGMAVLDQALATPTAPAEIVVMTGNDSEIARLTGAAPKPRPPQGAAENPPQPASSRPIQETTPMTPELNTDLAPLRAELAAMIGRLLKLDPAELRPTAGFGDFGFDSIALKEFADVLAKHYGIDFSPAVFFAHGSIDALAIYLRDTYPSLRPASVQEPAAPPAEAMTPPEEPRIPAPEPVRASGGDDGAIALIGMAGQFPGGPALDDFWRLIADGAIVVGPMPEARRQLLGLEGTAQAMGGFIDAIEDFDPAFFRMSRREAVHMDPQHRLALTATWQALENAGIVPSTLAGRSVGVFLGQQISGYTALLHDAAPEAIAQAALGNVNALMPNRISYHLDWHGPSESVDTACSSALVAVHRAVRALRGGECELAVAGGTSLLLDLKDVQSTQSLGVLSPDGRCYTFDARANGYVKGEGVGLVVLKPLARALADGDPIHAVIRGSAVNHGGRAQSLTAPNPKAQRDLIRAALADAAVTPGTVGYLETHGTGTELGDPVEIEALKEVFAGLTPASIALGAVKANIGHLEPASGIAGLCKVVLALGRRVLPPVAGLDTVNPYIELDDAALYLPREQAPWPRPDHGEPRRAGVSAFGFGGTNAHVILEEAPARPALDAEDGPALLLLSAPDPELLAPYARSLAAALETADAPALRDVAHTLMCGRSVQAARAALPVMDRAGAIQALHALAEHIAAGAPKPASVHLGAVGDQGAPASLGEEAEDQAFFARLAAVGNLGRLARFWVAGVEIDWPAMVAYLPTAQRGRRVHLPGMPLRRQRCWLDTPTRVAPASRLDIPAPVIAPPLPEPRPPVVTAAMPSEPAPAHPPTHHVATPAPATPSQIAGQIREIIAAALYVPAADLDDQARFMDLGLDSILAVEVTRAINAAFDLHIAATRLYDYPTVADLAAYVGDSLGLAGKAPDIRPVPVPVAATAPVVSVATPQPADPGPILATVRRILATALYIAPEDLDDQAGFVDLGLDSILAVEVADKLNAELGTDMQATRLYDHPTVAALAAYLASRNSRGTPASVPVDDPVLDFLRAQVAAALGIEPSRVDPGTPLDQLAIGPEPAARILDAIAQRFGSRLEVSEVGSCRDLAAVAALVRNRSAGPIASVSAPVSVAMDTPKPAPTAAASPPPLLSRLRAELAALLMVPEDSIETGLPLVDLGLDLIAAEALAERFRPLLAQQTLTARSLLAAPSLEAVAAGVVTPSPAIEPRPAAKPSHSVAPDPVSIDVAVVGIACRYPGAPDKNAFWELLREGRSGITPIPPERWNPEDHLAGLARPEQREAVRWGGFVADVDRFDPLFFNLSPREAELMDPQQRLFLEEAWHAFEDAGLSDQSLKGARCGIFIGAGQGDYSRHLPMDDPAQVTGQLLLGNTASILVSRIAYLLDLRGPAVALDTACSSALVAADMGFRAIREGACDIALVGGVNLMTTPQMHVMTAASGMLAPDGRCRTFDDAASGFVPGEGIGLVVLRRLDHALAAGDRIYGVIRAAGTNQDGKTSGITAPSSTSQEALEREVWRRFGINPADFGYIEAHGTGTRLGDPIEIDALTRAFAAHTSRRRDCPIGSVKTNIGHTLASAGAAGLIKTLLALHHGVIPPSLNFTTPNRHIDFAQTPFFVPTQAQPWHERRLAAVSSFGFSGTNAHIVLAAAPPAPPPTRHTPRPTLFVLTARDHAGLVRQAERLAEFLHTQGRTLHPLDIAHTLALRRSHLEQRLAIRAQDHAELIEALRAWLAGQADARVIVGKRRRDPAIPDPSLAARARQAPEALAELARLWSEGSTIDGETLVGEGRFVEVPGTVFAGMRCWIGTDPGQPATPVRVEPPTAQVTPITTPDSPGGDSVLRLDADQPVMSNHQVRGRPMLPGMASLVFFHSEARRRGYHGPLTAVAWRMPIVAPTELRLITHDTPDGLTLELQANGQQTAARALARRVEKPQPLPVDVAAIRADCRTTVEPAAIYRRLEAGGVLHGPGFRLLESVQVGAGQVLARLRPAIPGASAPLESAEVSPALLDAALQALGALEQAEAHGPALLPSGLRRCAVYAPLTGSLWAWLTVDAAASGPGRLLADLRLLDEQGEVLAELLGFEARAPQPLPPPDTDRDTPPLAPPPVTPPARPVSASANGATLLVLRPHWQPEAPPQGSPVHAPLILHSGPEADWSLRLAHTYGGDALRIDALSPEALAERIAALAPSRPLLFAAWRDPDACPLTPATLVETERRGVHKLRGIIQGLAHRDDPGRLLIVTRGSQAVWPGERIDPAFAALTGFARAAARELPGLVLDCVDLAPGQPTPAAEHLEQSWLLREPGAGVWAYRQGLRLRLRMARVLPDLASSSVLARGTVCLLLGGAGGLGRATSLWLAKQCGARIAWVGRRPQNAAIEAALAEVAQAGGEAIYLQADSSDPAALQRAVTTIRGRWGHIGLAWHGAIVLRDRSVRELGAADLEAALAPKSHSLLNLITALADDPPEQLCLCSSANAFTVNPGQANYAAACTFVDALALAQIQARGWRVRVLNWGIWGETGIVAEERYRQRARQAGVEPLATDEALEIFGWSLHSSLSQAIPLKVTAEALADIEADIAETVRFGDSASTLNLDAARTALRGAFDGLATDSLRSQADTLTALIHHGRERLFRIYAQLGLNRHAPARLDALATALGIVPTRHGLFRAHLDILARCGWVTLGPDANPWVETTGLLPADPLRDPPPAGDAARLLITALDGTVDVLTGRRPATDVLFPGGRNDLVEAVYRDDPAADAFNLALGRVVAALGSQRPLRVIEIGAGTGGATAAVIAALDRYAPGSSYVYTDVSPHFVATGEARYGQRPGTEFRVLDIGRHPAPQGFIPGSFDVFIAANVLHALPDLPATLGHAKALLKPGGAGLLLEATARSDFATFIFGLTDGWWASADPEWRIPHSPLLSVAGWRSVAASRGLCLEAVGQLAGSDGQSILLLSSDGWLPEPVTTQAPAIAPTPTVATRPGSSTLDTVRRLVGEVLRMAPADMDPDEPLERYGVDSLVVNDIHAKLETELGKFSRNLVFEAVTLRALVERLEANLATRPIATPPTPQPRHAAAEPVTHTTGAIAIIGIAGRFPDAGTIDAFWDNLERGHSAIGSLPQARRALWPSEQSYPGGYLADVAGFDALFFTISPNEAAAMDPQERLFLETAWASLEHAGRLPSAWEGKVGVFVGVMGRDYLRLGAESQGLGDAPAWSVANRVSHALNLTGPSLATDTACSSALTALHLAAESLQRGECDAALAGAVHLILHPASREGLRALGMLSASGVPRPFSQNADGLVGGEGVCCLILRRLDDALASGDRILGVIQATGLAANGRTRNYMAPSTDRQAEGLRRFLNHPRWALPDYIECQAMGSPSGDAIEVAGLALALPATPQALPIGSVEGAIGHLEAASGMAQIAKVLGMFQRGRLLPTVGVGEVHTEVAAAATGRFDIVRTARPWTAKTRRALVQSFGAGGGSAFALLEAPPPVAARPTVTGLQVVPLSARTATALRQMAMNLLDFLQRDPTADIPAIARTLQTGRVTFAHRLALWASDGEELVAALSDFLAERPGAWHSGEKRGAGGGNGKGPASSDPEALAVYWSQGHAVDWEVLWRDRPLPRPVALPGYPFAHRHCWLAASAPTRPEARPALQLLADNDAVLAPPALPPQRKLVVITGPGEPEDLRIHAEALAPPAAGEIIIEVQAAGLNFADLLCTRGLHPNLKSYPYLPGFEVAGVVAAVGAEVRTLKPGHKVMALTGGRGGLASHVTVPDYWATRIPAAMDPNLAAATPIGYLTMAHALERAGLRAGETILIQSAAGGTGPFAVQLALARGAVVIATAGNAAKLDALRQLGVHHAINYREQDFAAEVRHLTQNRGVDVVLNSLGGDAIQQGIDLLAPGGRYCEIALAGLRSAGPIDLSRLTDNQSLITVNLGRVLAEPDASRRALAEMAADLVAGRVQPLISRVFGMDQLAAALRHMDRRENVGKVILQPDAAIAVSASVPMATVAGVDWQSELRAIAATILGLEPTDIEADRPLEDYGLNSVGAMALMREVYRRFGLAVPVTLVYEAGSLAALAGRLGTPSGLGQIFGRATGQTYDPVVLVRDGSGPASFWVHGAPGDASWVTRLAETLGGETPVYGFEARGVSGSEAPHENITDMARDYVQAMRRIQPAGPYRLGGYSGGGVIAYEMARQLQAEGQAIEKLVLLDAYAPGNTALRGMQAAYGAGFIYQLAVNWFGRRWGMDQPLAADALANLDPEPCLEIALDYLYRHARPEVERDRLASYLRGMDRVGQAIGTALQSYIPQPLSSPIAALLIRCAHKMGGSGNPYHLPSFLVEADYTEGWAALLGQPPSTETIACDHFSLLDDPWLLQATTAIEAFFVSEGADICPVRARVRAVVEDEVRRVLMIELPEGIPARARLSDLGAHSVDRAEVTAAAMERLNVTVPLSALAGVGDIDGLIEVLARGAGAG